MTKQPNKTISLFDRFSLVIPPKLECYADGRPGYRVLFITDPKETFTVSFEEGMPVRDMSADSTENAPMVSFRCCGDGKFIHQRRRGSGSERFAFFHIELEDGDGKTQYLPGQIVVSDQYRWSDGVEPVLLELLSGIDIQKTEVGEKK